MRHTLLALALILPAGCAQPSKPTSPPVLVEAVPDSAFSNMMGYFRRDASGRAINPIDMALNAYGTFFIVQLNCASGGECKGYYLVGYNTRYQPTRPEHIGDLMADEDFLKEFGYHFAGDSAVVVVTRNYDEEEKKRDSSVAWYPLVIRGDTLPGAKYLNITPH